MQNVKPNGQPSNKVASPDYIIQACGDLELPALLSILGYQPTVGEIDEVALRIAHNGEGVGNRQATGSVAAILNILAPFHREPGTLTGTGSVQKTHDL